MNKLLIPTILVATVMIAGIFAFIPIEKASTVHTSIIAQQTIRELVIHDIDNIGTGNVDLITVKVDKDFTVEIGQFLVQSRTDDSSIHVETIRILNAAGGTFDTIDIENVTVDADTGKMVISVIGGEVLTSTLALPANWSIVIQGDCGDGTADSRVMLGIIAPRDAEITVT